MNELSGDGTATEQSLETQISHQLCHYPQEVSSPHPWQQSQLQGSDREDCPQSSDLEGMLRGGALAGSQLSSFSVDE